MTRNPLSGWMGGWKAVVISHVINVLIDEELIGSTIPLLHNLAMYSSRIQDITYDTHLIVS